MLSCICFRSIKGIPACDGFQSSTYHGDPCETLAAASGLTVRHVCCAFSRNAQFKCFDACPTNVCLPFTAQRMSQMTPNAKLIFLVRTAIAFARRSAQRNADRGNKVLRPRPRGDSNLVQWER